MALLSDAARRVTAHFEGVWDFDYQPTKREVDNLYAIAKRNQWDAATAIDWRPPVALGAPMAEVAGAYEGTEIIETLSIEERRELEIRTSAWRLSQFLHGEQAALMVCGQLVNMLPDIGTKLYAATQTVDEGRHVEAFHRYITKLDKVYAIDPLLKKLVDAILGCEAWEMKLLGMQIIIEGLAIGSFNIMRRETREPLLRQLLDYVLQDEGRHVNFGMVALQRALATMAEDRREALEMFAWKACDALFASGLGAFRSVAVVWEGFGWDVAAVSRDVGRNSRQLKTYNAHLFSEVLLPRLARLGLMTPRVRRLYRGSGLEWQEA